MGASNDSKSLLWLQQSPAILQMSIEIKWNVNILTSFCPSPLQSSPVFADCPPPCSCKQARNEHCISGGVPRRVYSTHTHCHGSHSFQLPGWDLLVFRCPKPPGPQVSLQGLSSIPLVERRWFFRSLPAQTLLWFCEFFIVEKHIIFHVSLWVCSASPRNNTIYNIPPPQAPDTSAWGWTDVIFISEKCWGRSIGLGVSDLFSEENTETFCKGSRNKKSNQKSSCT